MRSFQSATQSARATLGGTLLLTLLAALGGCSTQAPCLHYQPQMVTRMVSLRGHGTMEVTRETLVCTRRANFDVSLD